MNEPQLLIADLQKNLAEVEAERDRREHEILAAITRETKESLRAEAAEAKLAEVLERFAEGRGDREDALATLEEKP